MNRERFFPPSFLASGCEFRLPARDFSENQLAVLPPINIHDLCPILTIGIQKVNQRSSPESALLP